MSAVVQVVFVGWEKGKFALQANCKLLLKLDNVTKTNNTLNHITMTETEMNRTEPRLNKKNNLKLNKEVASAKMKVSRETQKIRVSCLISGYSFSQIKECCETVIM